MSRDHPAAEFNDLLGRVGKSNQKIDSFSRGDPELLGRHETLQDTHLPASEAFEHFRGGLGSAEDEPLAERLTVVAEQRALDLNALCRGRGLVLRPAGNSKDLVAVFCEPKASPHSCEGNMACGRAFGVEQGAEYRQVGEHGCGLLYVGGGEKGQAGIAGDEQAEEQEG